MRCNIYTFGKAAVFYLEQISDILPSSGAVPLMCIVLPGSVMVTQLPVKELIVGSNPTRGAECALREQMNSANGCFAFLTPTDSNQRRT